jgi:hypothetical protein
MSLQAHLEFENCVGIMCGMFRRSGNLEM